VFIFPREFTVKRLFVDKSAKNHIKSLFVMVLSTPLRFSLEPPEVHLSRADRADFRATTIAEIFALTSLMRAGLETRAHK
jgi:hypothetical protein